MPPAVYPMLRTTTPQADPGLPHTLPISDVDDLQAMNNNKAGNYYLTGNINASETSGWNGGAGFVPIGNNVNPFTGTLDGCGFTITGLFINRISTSGVGLFGVLGGSAKIANVNMTNCDITGEYYTGALVGSTGDASSVAILIQNCHAAGAVSCPKNYVGGLVGMAGAAEDYKAITIYDCSSSCTVTGWSGYDVGGFAGALDECVAQNCYATGDVDGGESSDYAGGFTGSIYKNVTVSYCYATGNVYNCRNEVGGFLGRTGLVGEGITVSRCYATGNVQASDDEVGGFVGFKRSSSTFEDCYATGNVNGSSDVGGFAGQGANVLTNAYSIGAATGGATVGGFLGAGGGTGSGCYWDKEASGNPTSDGDFDEVGRTTRQMGVQANFPTYDFDTVWYMPVYDRQIIMGRPRTSYPVRGKHTAHRNLYG